MESTISTYNPQMKINYRSDYSQQPNQCVINNQFSQFNAFHGPNSYNQPNFSKNSYTLPRLDDQHLTNLNGFCLNGQPKMSQSQRNHPNTLHRSHLKPTSGPAVLSGPHSNQLNGHSTGPTNSFQPAAYSSNLPNHPSSASANHAATNQPNSRTNRREIPRLPNAIIMNKLTSNSSQPSSLTSSTLSSVVSTLSTSQGVPRNALQSPAFG